MHKAIARIPVIISFSCENFPEDSCSSADVNVFILWKSPLTIRSFSISHFLADSGPLIGVP